MQARARQQLAQADSGDDAPELASTSHKRSKRQHQPDAEDSPPDEDAFYQETAQRATAHKKRKADKYTAPAPRPPLADPLAEGPRKISRAVEKNRGLTPHRRRDLKNPRVKVRLGVFKETGTWACLPAQACPGRHGVQQSGRLHLAAFLGLLHASCSILETFACWCQSKCVLCWSVSFICRSNVSTCSRAQFAFLLLGIIPRLLLFVLA